MSKRTNADNVRAPPIELGKTRKRLGKHRRSVRELHKCVGNARHLAPLVAHRHRHQRGDSRRDLVRQRERRLHARQRERRTQAVHLGAVQRREEAPVESDLLVVFGGAAKTRFLFLSITFRERCSRFARQRLRSKVVERAEFGLLGVHRVLAPEFGVDARRVADQREFGDDGVGARLALPPLAFVGESLAYRRGVSLECGAGEVEGGRVEGARVGGRADAIETGDDALEGATGSDLAVFAAYVNEKMQLITYWG